MEMNTMKRKKLPVNTNLIGLISKYNKYALRDGDVVILDHESPKSSMVMIKANTIVGLYSQIHGVNESPSDSWTVLTSRLTPLRSLPKK